MTIERSGNSGHDRMVDLLPELQEKFMGKFPVVGV